MNGERARPAPRRRRLIAAAAILGLCFVAIVVSVRMTHADRVLPGVRVAGLALGGATEEEVARRLAPVAAQAARPITLVAEDRELAIEPGQAGYFADVPQTATRALRSGRSGPLGGAWATFAGLFASRDVPLAERIDEAQLARAVALAAGRLGRPSSPGDLVIEPGTLKITTRAPRSGREVDRAALTARLRDALTGRPRAPVPVPLRTRRVASRAAVDAVGRAARRYLQQELRLTGAGEPLVVGPAELSGILALESREDGRKVRLGANDARLAELVARIAARRDRPPRDAQLDAPARAVRFDDKDDASWRPRPADLTVTAPPRTGRTVKRDALAAAVEAAIRAGRHEIELPTALAEPAVSAAAAERMDALIGTFTTTYVPGQPRVTNIEQIAKDVDGTIVAPGARFSLNAAAGARTEAGGYVEAPFIADGKIEPSIGGGVSQFSTTLYNAAYFAGLRIDSHRPHSFYIDRYPAGREATLNFPDIDLAWTNDTRAPVLIRTSTDADSVAVSLYGDTRGRRVQARTGERQPLPDGDFSIVVTRVVYHPGGRVARERFTTRYDKPPAEE